MPSNQLQILTHTPTGKWQARLRHGGKLHHLGRFAEERDAIAAVRAGHEAAAEVASDGKRSATRTMKAMAAERD